MGSGGTRHYKSWTQLRERTMLIFGHTAFGILQSHVFRRFRNAGAVSVGIVAAVVPDIPALLTGGPGTLGYLAHRIATNSVVLAPLWALIPVAAVWCVLRRRLKNSLPELYLLSLFAYGGHIFLDWLTPFGTQLLYPFSDRIYSGDFFHTFDPLFMILSVAVVIVFIKAARARKLLGRRALFLFATLYVLYAGATGVCRHVATRTYKDYLADEYPGVRYITTVPRTFWRWKGIAATEQHYVVAIRSSGTTVHKQYPRMLELPEQVSTDVYYDKFLNYARFPVAVPGDGEVGVTNLIYSPNSYRLIMTLDDNGDVSLRDVTGFDLLDRGM